MGISKFVFSKLCGSPCQIEKEYIPSDRWLLKSGQDWLYPTGRFTFNDPDPSSKSYRTVFGPVFSHSALWYECNNENMSKALTRIMCDPDPEHALGQNQDRFLTNPPRYARRYFKRLSEHFAATLAREHQDWDESLLLYADKPHPKRKLRVQAALQVINDCLWSQRNRDITTFIKRVSTKFKKYEFAKVGKYPRSIADLSVVGSLIAGWLVETLKTSLSQFQYSTDMDIHFAKSANYSTLKKVFNNIHDGGEFYYAIHSDDGAGAVRLRCGERLWFKSDISTCDASHTGALFKLLLQTMPPGFHRDYLSRAVEQLKLDVNVMNAAGRPEYRLKTNTASVYNTTLFSGSILTTLINCFANTLIGLQLSRIPRDNPVAFSRAVSTYCAQVGYKVTFDSVKHIQQVDFLKHFPTADIEPALCRGTIYRTFGQCIGDIPVYTTRDKKIKARIFNSQILRGFVHCGDDVVIDALRSKWNYGQGVRYANYLLENSVDTDHPTVRVSIDDLYYRYGTCEWEIHEAACFAKNADISDVVRANAFDKFYGVDYGYNPPSEHNFM